MDQKKTERINFVKRFCKNKLAVAGLIVLTAIMLAVLILPFFSPYGEAEIDVTSFSSPPSQAHLLGT